MGVKKVLLINPSLDYIYDASSFKQRLLKHLINVSPPGGLKWIQAFLKSKGYEARLFDFYLDPSLNGLIKTVKSFKPDVIGFSVSSPALRNASMLLRKLKKHQSFYSVIGGPHLSTNPQFLAELNYYYGIVG